MTFEISYEALKKDKVVQKAKDLLQIQLISFLLKESVDEVKESGGSVKESVDEVTTEMGQLHFGSDEGISQGGSSIATTDMLVDQAPKQVTKDDASHQTIVKKKIVKKKQNTAFLVTVRWDCTYEVSCEAL